MSLSVLTSAAAGTVWMTERGYPAIIISLNSSTFHGLVISPDGTKNCIWDSTGVNQSGLPDFFNIKYSPELIEHRFAVIKSGCLVACVNDFEDAETNAHLNDTEIFCKFSELIQFVDTNTK